MKTFLTAALLAFTALCDLSPIEVKGNAFYPKGSNERFYIRGLDYQPGGSSKLVDPLVDKDQCQRDVAKFKDLGVNMIRVYSVDNSANHDDCMKALDDAGIYLLLDVNTPKNSLNRYNNDSLKASYNTGYLQHVFATIDAFKNYSNTFGYFAANEVINAANNTIAAPYIKAVVRDMKKYIKSQADRAIPVGYSAADIADSRWQQMSYLNCGDDETRIDMFGMNDYSWCGTGSSFQISGYSQNVQNYGNYSIPMFLSEYGCNTVRPRTFPEISAIYSTKMSSVYSGGLVYEYSEEGSNYGLVKIVNNSTVTETADYTNFKNALSKAQDPQGDAGASTSRQKSRCPTYQKGVWEVEDNTQIPDTPKNAQKYFTAGAGKPLGLDGPGTQSGSSLDGDESQSNSNVSSAVDSESSSASATGSSGSDSSSAGASGSSTSGSSSKSKKSKSKNEASQHTAGYGLSAVFCLLLTIF